MVDHADEKRQRFQTAEIAGDYTHTAYSKTPNVSEPEAERINRYTVQWIQSGDDLWAEFDVREDRMAGGLSANVPSTKFVVNPEYFAHFDGKDGTHAYRYDHESLDSMTARGKLQVQLHQKIDPAARVFGNGSSYLTDMVDRHLKGGARWDAVEQANDQGGMSYVLRLFRGANASPESTQSPLAEFTIDPAIGFGIRRCTLYNDDGSVGFDTRVEWEAGSDGEYAPKSMVSLRYSGWPRGGADNALIARDEMHFRTFKPLSSVSEEQFTLAALGIPEGAYVVRHLIDGSLEGLVRYGDAYIPMEVNTDIQQVTAHRESLDILNHETETARPEQQADHQQQIKQDRTASFTETTIRERTQDDHARGAWSWRLTVAIAVGSAGIAIFVVFWLIRMRGARHGA